MFAIREGVKIIMSILQFLIIVIIHVFPEFLCITATQSYTFCMLTASRPGNVSYLAQVTALYQEQDVFARDETGLIIIDVDGSTIHEANRKPGALPVGVQLKDRVIAACNTPDVEGIPSCQVRQRTLDILAGLSACRSITSGWVILVEDDCEPCPGALSESLHALASLSVEQASMAKFSANMCSTAFPAARVSAYSQATLDRLYTHPHDIIKAEDWAPYPARVYRHDRNLWHHIGNVSTEPHKNTREWQAQYRALREDSCFTPM